MNYIDESQWFMDASKDEYKNFIGVTLVKKSSTKVEFIFSSG